MLPLSYAVATLLAAASVTALDLARAPSEFIGTRVTLSRIACVEEVHSGYVCVAPAGGSLVAIDAAILDADDVTDLDTVQYVHDECLGTVNLDRPACVFNVTFAAKASHLETASGPSGSSRLTRFYAGTMKLARS